MCLRFPGFRSLCVFPSGEGTRVILITPCKTPLSSSPGSRKQHKTHSCHPSALLTFPCLERPQWRWSQPGTLPSRGEITSGYERLPWATFVHSYRQRETQEPGEMPKWCLLAVLSYVTWSRVSQPGSELGVRHLSAPLRGAGAR